MVRIILILSLVATSWVVQGQSVGIFPVNTPWLLANSFRPNLQIKTSQGEDWLVVTWIKGISGPYDYGGEDGFSVEYRIQTNRDFNVEFRSNTFIGIFYSRVRNDNDDIYSTPYTINGFGLNFGNYFKLSDNIVLEAYVGLGNFKEVVENSYSFRFTRVTGGANIGFRF